METKKKILRHIKDNGIKLSWLSKKAGISQTHLYLVLSNKRTLTDKNKDKINEILNTKF